MFRILLLYVYLFAGLVTNAQDTNRAIEFPDIPGFLTLVCDFHIHTVFSDGSVWPDIRVQEAVRDGLDAIALTEHIEYQPHSTDIPHIDRNRSFELAREYAKPHDLLIVHGAEITRDLPPGHANAIFITDANALNVKDSVEAYREAVRQGAFIFWNHPNWLVQQEDAVPVLTEQHEWLIKEGLLHGIEVVNDLTFSVEALDIALSNELTAMGTSDIHGLVDWQYEVSRGGHRPVCLVFAREKTESAIREALFEGRTVAWFKQILAGNEKWITPLVNSCLSSESLGYIGPSTVYELVIYNRSDVSFWLQHHGPYAFYSDNDLIAIPPHGRRVVQIIRPQEDIVKTIEFEVTNAVTGKDKKAVISFPLE